MSFSMQARAVPAAGLPQDFAGVTAAFADTDDELDRLETDLSISKDFSEVHELCLTAPPGHGRCELPVFGGNVHEDPAGIEAPSVTLEASEVREAAEFLRTHPFDELWRAAEGASERTGDGRRPRSAPSSPRTTGRCWTSTAGRPRRAPRW
ncbi:hypothetical protein ACWEQP_03170 [Streptomyces sp. NPDC004044]